MPTLPFVPFQPPAVSVSSAPPIDVEEQVAGGPAVATFVNAPSTVRTTAGPARVDGEPSTRMETSPAGAADAAAGTMRTSSEAAMSGLRRRWDTAPLSTRARREWTARVGVLAPGPTVSRLPAPSWRSGCGRVLRSPADGIPGHSGGPAPVSPPAPPPPPPTTAAH